ncbi:MAG: acyl-CoA dehydrogenase family protein, partial [Streptosporangiaceae bacterium]
MDFTPAEAEIEASRLATRVLGAAPPSTTDFDERLWKELGNAGLLSLALPADLGGENLGALATAAVLTETGRHAARIPALATLALGVL